jgi:HK97 family phage major capsid protein
MDPKELEARRIAILERIDNLGPDDDADALVAEADEVRSQIDEYNGKVAKANEARSRLSDVGFDRPTPTGDTNPGDAGDQRGGGQDAENRVGPKGLVDYFMESGDLEEFRSTRVGRRTQSGGSQGGTVVEGVDTRSLITGVGGISNILDPIPRTPGIVQAVADRPLGLVDLLTQVPSTSDAFGYVRDNSSTPQGTAAETAEGGTKPESTYTWELVTDTIKTVAHWTDIARQALDDHTQLRGLVQTRLFYGLAYRVDNQIINGDGTSNTMVGILNTSGINSYNTGVGNDEAKIISLRRGKTLVRHNEYAANVVILNPDDWETVELSTDDTGRWRVTPNVQDNLTPRIWGMNVVDTNTVAAGTALEGDAKLGATLYDRQRAALYVTDSDASKFRQNILTLLAELRLGLAVNRPKAWTKIVFQGAE